MVRPTFSGAIKPTSGFWKEKRREEKRREEKRREEKRREEKRREEKEEKRKRREEDEKRREEEEKEKRREEEREKEKRREEKETRKRREEKRERRDKRIFPSLPVTKPVLLLTTGFPGQRTVRVKALQLELRWISAALVPSIQHAFDGD
ncbi:MAG: hypothetical protein FRX49_08730 [Trebouxia sp. A1-2]|nr:MAG: hypothetical protein FRX49_08730 [Trebouxia sp. A1-2]